MELDIAVLQEINQSNDLLYDDAKMVSDVEDVSANGASGNILEINHLALLCSFIELLTKIHLGNMKIMELMQWTPLTI